MLRDYVALMRPAQYVKNLSLFLPAFFALRLDEPAVLLRTLGGFAAYCLTASGVYILNDYLDREEDRLHPVKRHRPLAAEKVSASKALLLMGVLLAAGVSLFLLFDKSAFYLVSIYVIINLIYTFRVKQIAILDLVFIAAGFLIRIATGAALAEPHIPLSLWIELMIFLGAMFLGLAKRRDDVLLAAQGTQIRKSIKGYNLEFINAAMVIMASVLIVSYIFWTLSPEVQQRLGSSSLHLTVIFVLIGVMRYLQITFVEGESGNPGKVFLQDRFLQLTLLGWILSFIVLLY